MPALSRSYTASRFALLLNGSKTAGYLKSVEGGGVKADVITEALSTQYFKKKHIGAPKYEPLTLEFNFNMDQTLFDWINNSWKGNYTRKNGSIIAADFNLKPVSEIEFFNAMISEVTIPALDGSSKDPAYFRAKFAPEYTRNKKPSSSALKKVDTKAQKQWLPSNFRLKIDGLDCKRVQKIDSFTIKQTVARDDIGDARDYALEPTSIEFPNLAIALAEIGAQTWYDWHQDFIITGNNGEDNEKSGTLDFLAPNGTTVLGTIHFFNLGIFQLATDKAEANQDQIRQVTAGLYCERMELTLK